MKKLCLLLILVAIFDRPSFTQENVIWHVSPDGLDSNPGTLENPFKTLERAQEQLRTRLNRQSDVLVYLRGGHYPIDHTIEFESADGGSEKASVTYAAYKNETPILSGGIPIIDWEKQENGLWTATYEGEYFRQFYVNGKRRTRARHPNSGRYFRIKGVDFKHKELLLGKNEIESWPKFDQIEMILQMHWSESLLRLQSMSLHGHMKVHNVNVTIHPDDAAIFFHRPNPNHRTGQSYHLENCLAFVDAPGEWYLDRDAGRIYYYPLPGESITDFSATVPQLETLLKVEGSLDNPVRNLTFQGLTFAYSNWKMPGNKPYLNVQAGFYNLTADSANNQTVQRPRAAVYMAGAHNVAFKDNRFENLGSVALDMHYGTRKNLVEGNVFRDIAGGGILVGKFMQDSTTFIHIPYNPKDKREVSTHDVVQNNLITRTGQDYYGTCAVAAGYVAGLSIAHNTIVETPYSGISVGWGWTDEENAARDNLIENNDISRVMTVMADGAGIYTLSLQPGTTIRGNFIHDLERSQWASPWPIAGIYLDYKSGGTLDNPLVVENNLVDVNPNMPYKGTYAGIVLHVYNYFSNDNSDAAKTIAENAGLQPHYVHLKDYIK